MAHFSINYSDFDSPNTLFKSIAKNQKNPVTNTPLTSSGSKSGDPQFITTLSMADIQQGVALYKPKGLILDSQEAALTRAFQGYIDHEQGGGGDINNVISEGTGPFVPPSIRSLIGDNPGGLDAIKRLNAGISDNYSNATGSGTIGDAYHGDPETTKLHARIDGGGNDIDNIPETWRNVGRLKDSELIPEDFAGMDNGQIDLSILVTFSNRNTSNQPDTPENRQLWAPAAAAVQKLMDSAESYGFEGPFIIDAYRSWNTQDAAYRRAESKDPITGEYIHPEKHGLVNPPGTSMHGWGFAVDWHSYFRFQHASGRDGNSPTLSGIEWLYLNSYRFGIVHPEWALPSGFHPEEWHWEYRGHVYKFFLSSSNIPR